MAYNCIFYIFVAKQRKPEMKKLLYTLMAVLLLVGCTNNDDDDSEDGGNGAPPPQTITWLNIDGKDAEWKYSQPQSVADRGDGFVLQGSHVVKSGRVFARSSKLNGVGLLGAVAKTEPGDMSVRLTFTYTYKVNVLRDVPEISSIDFQFIRTNGIDEHARETFRKTILSVEPRIGEYTGTVTFDATGDVSDLVGTSYMYITSPTIISAWWHFYTIESTLKVEQSS